MKTTAVIGLGWGDEGKGSAVDYLTWETEADTVIRFNGGPQAAHHVVLPDGTWHCFSQFGSGTLIPGVRTFLHGNMLISPLHLLMERQVLIDKGFEDVQERLFIDRRCPIVGPFHQMLGQVLEASRGKEGFGSVGMGVGQATLDEDPLRLEDALSDRVTLRKKLSSLIKEKQHLAEELSWNDEIKQIYEKFQKDLNPDLLANFYMYFAYEFSKNIVDGEEFISNLENPVILEGAQGTLLDPVLGPYPYVTKTDSTLNPARELLPIDEAIGVVRAYGHRHGAGPFVTEDPSLEIAEDHNLDNRWQGGFRVGAFDIPSTRYAIEGNGGVDSLMLTNLDRLSGQDKIRVCFRYQEKQGTKNRLEYLQSCTPQYREFPGWGKDISGVRKYEELPFEARFYVEFLEQVLEVPIRFISVGPTREHKIVKSE